MNLKNHDQIDMQLDLVGKIDIQTPNNLIKDTIKMMKGNQKNDYFVPVMMFVTFVINMIITFILALLIVTILPLTLWQWILIGGIYGTTNTLMYGALFVYREKINDLSQVFR